MGTRDAGVSGSLQILFRGFTPNGPRLLQGGGTQNQELRQPCWARATGRGAAWTCAAQVASPWTPVSPQVVHNITKRSILWSAPARGRGETVHRLPGRIPPNPRLELSVFVCNAGGHSGSAREMHHLGLPRPCPQYHRAIVAKACGGGFEPGARLQLARTRFAVCGAWPCAAAVGGGAGVRRPGGRRRAGPRAGAPWVTCSAARSRAGSQSKTRPSW